MKSSNIKDVIQYMIPFVETKLNQKLTDSDINIIERSYSDVVSRSKSLIECADLLEMYYKPDSYDAYGVPCYRADAPVGSAASYHGREQHSNIPRPPMRGKFWNY